MDRTVEAPRSAAALWWALLSQRVRELAEFIPGSLSGVLQFVVRGGGEPAAFVLHVAPGRVTAESGVAPRFDAWIETTEADLEAILHGGGEPELRVTGRDDLLRGLLDLVERFETPKRAGLFRGGR